MFSIMTYSVLAPPVMSIPSMVSLMSVVIDAVPMGITVSMVGGGTMLPMAIRLPTCDCTGHFPCNCNDHCVDYVLMGSATLTAQ